MRPARRPALLAMIAGDSESTAEPTPAAGAADSPSLRGSHPGRNCEGRQTLPADLEFDADSILFDEQLRDRAREYRLVAHDDIVGRHRGQGNLQQNRYDHGLEALHFNGL